MRCKGNMGCFWVINIFFAFFTISLPYIKRMEEATSLFFCYGSSLFHLDAVCSSFGLSVTARAFLWDLCTVSATAWFFSFITGWQTWTWIDEETSSVCDCVGPGDVVEAAAVWGACMGETHCFASCARAACRNMVWPPQLWPLWDSYLDADFSLIASFSSDFFGFCLFEKILSMICQLCLWEGKSSFLAVLHRCRLWGK